jgi:transposase
LEKVQVLREHLENQITVSKISEQYNINPNQFYLWKKELFAGALERFPNKRNSNTDQQKLNNLESKLKEKDSLISEIVEDNLRLKKKLNGGIK